MSVPEKSIQSLRFPHTHTLPLPPPQLIASFRAYLCKDPNAMAAAGGMIGFRYPYKSFKGKTRHDDIMFSFFFYPFAALANISGTEQ
jgi:hypothetical protein